MVLVEQGRVHLCGEDFQLVEFLISTLTGGCHGVPDDLDQLVYSWTWERERRTVISVHVDVSGIQLRVWMTWAN